MLVCYGNDVTEDDSELEWRKLSELEIIRGLEIMHYLRKWKEMMD